MEDVKALLVLKLADKADITILIADEEAPFVTM
jgi:hypothetical protein